MIVDEKGRLFGKINLLDLLIVVVLIGIGLVVFYKMNNSKVINPFIQKDKVQTVFYMEEIWENVAASIKEGEVVIDRVSGAVFGKVKSIDVFPSISFGTNIDGQLVTTTKQGYRGMRIIVEGEGVFSESRVVFGNNDFYINKSIEIRVGNTALWPKIESISKSEE